MYYFATIIIKTITFLVWLCEVLNLDLDFILIILYSIRISYKLGKTLIKYGGKYAR